MQSSTFNKYWGKTAGVDGVREEKRLKRATAAPDPQPIKVSVWAQDGSEVCFQIRKTSKLIKLMTAYCKKKAVCIRDYRFLHNGQLLKGHQTVGQVGMEDGDKVDAMVAMEGGGAA